MPSLSICTTNAGKRREFERLLKLDLTAVAYDLDEIQSLDPRKVCRAKAAAAYAALGTPVLVDDSGFELGALNGFPGALVTWVIEAGGSALLHRLLPPSADPSATAVTAIAFADATGVSVFADTLGGMVIAEPRGENGFGFDDVFIAQGEHRTLAEMSDAEKDAISPRGRALAALATHLKNVGFS